MNTTRKVIGQCVQCNKSIFHGEPMHTNEIGEKFHQDTCMNTCTASDCSILLTAQDIRRDNTGHPYCEKCEEETSDAFAELNRTPEEQGRHDAIDAHIRALDQ